MSHFDIVNLRPFSIGLERIVNQLQKFDDFQKPAYPPYNIIRTDDNSYTIEIAVAGFKKEDLSVELTENVLTVSGKQEHQETEPVYEFKGIASRNFERKFQLADTIKIQLVHLDDGILRIQLTDIIPEHKKPKKFEIT